MHLVQILLIFCDGESIIVGNSHEILSLMLYYLFIIGVCQFNKTRKFVRESVPLFGDVSEIELQYKNSFLRFNYVSIIQSIIFGQLMQSVN
jgi:hypothetical protein